MSTIVSESRTLPPVNCASWCEDGDGHPNVSHPRDQYCTTSEESVTLARHGLVDMGEGQWRLDDLRAYLTRERFEGDPHVSLAHGDASVAELTLEEAETFARGLLHLVETARDGGAA